MSEATRAPKLDFEAFADEFHAWAVATFGPKQRASGICDHIRKELAEIEADPSDVEEWCDVIFLALDGAMRAGASAEGVAARLRAKLAKNKGRTWPDWRTVDPSKAIEHDRAVELDALNATGVPGDLFVGGPLSESASPPCRYCGGSGMRAKFSGDLVWCKYCTPAGRRL